MKKKSGLLSSRLLCTQIFVASAYGAKNYLNARPGLSLFFNKRIYSLVFLSLLFIANTNAQTKTRVTGSANWNTAATWIQMRTGTARFFAGSTAVTGTGTLFLSEIQAGDVLMLDATSGIVRGTVSTVNTNTSITLVANAGANIGPLAYGRQQVPGATDNVQIGNTVTAATVDVTLDGASATVNTLTIIADTRSHSLTHASTNSLTVTSGVTLNQPTFTGRTAAWNINGGSATVGGLLSLPGVNTNSRIARVTLTSGTLDANGGITFTGTTVTNKVINMSGGAGTLNMKGALTGSANATLTAGVAGSIFCYADNVATQTVNYFGAGAYYNLFFNNGHANGAVLSAAITTARVINNVRVTGGLMSNGGFGIALNNSKLFEVVNGATFKMTATTGMVTGTTITKTFGATSTVDYNGAAQTVSQELYGNLTLSTSGIKTMPATPCTLQGNFTTSGTISATALNTLTIGGDVTLGTGTTLVAGAFTHNIAGDWIGNGGTFTPGSSTLNFNGTSVQDLGGTTAPLTFFNVTISNTAAAVTASINTNIPGTLYLNGTATFFSCAPAVVINTAAPAGIITGNGTVQVTRIIATPSGTAQYRFVTYTVLNLTIDYAGAGDQTVNALNGVGIKLSGSGIKTATAAITLSGTMEITSGVTFDMATQVLSGAFMTISGTGTLKTQNASAAPIPAGKTWTFTVEYNRAAGGQTVAGGTYTSITNSNTSGTNNVQGALSVSGNLTLNASSVLDLVTFPLSGALTSVAGTGTLQTQNTSAAPVPSGITWTGTVEYNSLTGGQTVMGGTYNDLNNSNTSGTNTAAGALTVDGVLTVTSSGTLDLATFALGGALTSVAGTGILRTQNTSSTPLPASKTWTCTVEYNNLTGGQSVVGGIYSNLTNSNTSSINTATANVTVNGAFTLNASSSLNMVNRLLDGTLTSISGTGSLRTQNSTATPIPSGKTWTGAVYYNRTAGGQTIVAGSYTNFFNQNTSGTNTVGASFSVSGNFTLNNASVLDMATFALSGGTLVPIGVGTLKTQNTSAAPVPTGKSWGCTIEFNRTAGGQSIPAGTYTHLTNSNTSGTNTAIGAVSVSGTFTLNASSVLDMASYALSGAISSVSGTGTLKTQNTSGAPIPAGLSWPGNVEYNHATIAQTISGGTYYDLLNNNGGGAILGAVVTITNNIDMTGGTLELGTFDLIVINLASISNFDDVHYFITNISPLSGGFLIQTVDDTKIFPVGTSNYTPLTLNNVGLGDDFSVRVCEDVYANGTGGGTHSKIDNAVNRTWLVEEATAGGSDVTLTMQWNTANENLYFDNSICGICHYTTLWDEPASYVAANVIATDVFSISRSGITTFSPFAVGDIIEPLPVELISFNAKLNNSRVDLSWTTATEINNSYFAIERSADGIYFEVIDIVEGAGNSNNIIQYSYSDTEPLWEITSYYRLKQVDFDGTSSYSQMRVVEEASRGQSLSIGTIYPVPVQSNINIPLEALNGGNCTIAIIDMSGRMLYRNEYNLGPATQICIVPTAGLSQGTYILRIQNDAESHSIKLIK